jgi:predicted CXXCH cytochrome family protein
MRRRAMADHKTSGETPHDEARSRGRGSPVPTSATLAALTALFLAGALAVLASAAPPRLPRTPQDIAKSLSAGAHAQDCSSCHDLHGDSAPTPAARLLLGPDDNTFCERCHTVPWAGGSFGGGYLFAGSAHGAGPTMLWPGPDPPGRTEADAAGKCVNCHDPHGWTDASGEIPSLLLAREQNLCYACHDGAPAATNIRLDMEKPFRHPAPDYAGRHSGPLESMPADFGTSPVNRRHAECEDCHNPHAARHDRLAPVDPDESKVNLGVSRVRVVNGGPGAAPSYFFTAGADTLTTPVAEYQLCYKCHSSWTTQPSGQTDLARVLNPANPSFHPVEERGRNAGIDVGAFTTGWGPNSLVRCSDCHGSDNDLARGPHGSIYRYILRRAYTASPAQRTTQSDELCFLCHGYDTYANPGAAGSRLSASRFNPPAAMNGHAFHVDAERVPCYACHETHGSTSFPHLIARGRVPGLIGYTETLAGGTCTPTCHRSESYSVNYAR